MNTTTAEHKDHILNQLQNLVTRNADRASAFYEKAAQAALGGIFEPRGLFEARGASQMAFKGRIAIKALLNSEDEIQAVLREFRSQIMTFASWGSRSTDPYSAIEERHIMEALHAILEICGGI